MPEPIDLERELRAIAPRPATGVPGEHGRAGGAGLPAAGAPVAPAAPADPRAGARHGLAAILASRWSSARAAAATTRRRAPPASRCTGARAPPRRPTPARPPSRPPRRAVASSAPRAWSSAPAPGASRPSPTAWCARRSGSAGSSRRRRSAATEAAAPRRSRCASPRRASTTRWPSSSRLGTVRSIEGSTQDLTGSYDATSSQLGDARTQRRAIVARLATASGAEADRLRTRLAAATAQVDRLERRQRELRARTTYATVDLTVVGARDGRRRAAGRRSLDAGRRLARRAPGPRGRRGHPHRGRELRGAAGAARVARGVAAATPARRRARLDPSVVNQKLGCSRQTRERRRRLPANF